MTPKVGRVPRTPSCHWNEASHPGGLAAKLYGKDEFSKLLEVGGYLTMFFYSLGVAFLRPVTFCH